MTETLVPIAVKFLEEGGLYALLGVYLMSLALGGVIVVALFNRYAASQEARIKEGREMSDKAITALIEVKGTIDAATRVAEVNSRLSEANRNTIEGFRSGMEAILRSMADRSRGGR